MAELDGEGESSPETLVLEGCAPSVESDSLGADFQAKPATFSWTESHLDLFGRGHITNKLFHKWCQRGWSEFEEKEALGARGELVERQEAAHEGEIRCRVRWPDDLRAWLS